MNKKIVKLEFVMYENQNIIGMLNCIIGDIMNQKRASGNIPVYQLTATDWITDFKPVADSEVKKSIKQLELGLPDPVIRKPPQDKKLMQAITEEDYDNERY